MAIPNRDDIRELIDHKAGHSVSVYLPTHPNPPEERQDSIRIKNLVGEAVEKLMDHGLRRPDAETMMKPLEQLPQGSDIWTHRRQALACFCADEFFRTFHLPFEVSESLVVQPKFYIRPLLPLLGSGRKFYILALSQDDARLFEATANSFEEMEIPPIERVEVDDAQKPHQYHAHHSPSQGQGGTAEAIYHGQGGPGDREKADLANFFHRVDESIAKALHGRNGMLVLACVDYLVPIYQSANSYPSLSDSHLSGNPQRKTNDELRRSAWDLVDQHNRTKVEDAVNKWKELQESDRASDDIREIVLATDAGRVDSLFLTRGAKRRGKVEPDARSVDVFSDDSGNGGEDLLDYAAVQTLKNGGDVYVVDKLPQTDSPLAATFRY